MKIYGVTGWKNNGKTTLMERLISEISARGFTVSSVKHAHHNFDVDTPGKDSYRHRDAGAVQTLVASEQRWALMTELRDQQEPELQEILAQLQPVDLVLIEGYKNAAHPKIEVHRVETGKGLLAEENSSIAAIASNETLANLSHPVFDLNDIKGIASFILEQVELE